MKDEDKNSNFTLQENYSKIGHQ